MRFQAGMFEWTFDGDLQQRGAYDTQDGVLTITVHSNYGSPQRILGDYSRPYSITGNSLTWGDSHFTRSRPGDVTGSPSRTSFVSLTKACRGRRAVHDFASSGPGARSAPLNLGREATHPRIYAPLAHSAFLPDSIGLCRSSDFRFSGLPLAADK
jgi:hypothetical protein